VNSWTFDAQADLNDAQQRIADAPEGTAGQMAELHGALHQAVQDYEELLAELGGIKADAARKDGKIRDLEERLRAAEGEASGYRCASAALRACFW
jgi:chromosome segregation ATPase